MNRTENDITQTQITQLYSDTRTIRKEEKEKQPTGRKGLSCTVICILRKKKINIASSKNAKRKKEKHVEIRR